MWVYGGAGTVGVIELGCHIGFKAFLIAQSPDFGVNKIEYAEV